MVFDGYIATIHKARLIQPILKRRFGAYALGDALLRKPMSGFTGCCARVVSGHTPQRRCRKLQ